jgi:hypothetical protein
VTVHDLAFVRHPGMFPRDWRMLYRAGLRAVARRADAVVVPSAFTADELREHSGVDPARVHVTPLAASLPVEPDHDVDATLERLGGEALRAVGRHLDRGRTRLGSCGRTGAWRRGRRMRSC